MKIPSTTQYASGYTRSTHDVKRRGGKKAVFFARSGKGHVCRDRAAETKQVVSTATALRCGKNLFFHIDAVVFRGYG
jgi:hypothetical protein